MKLNQEKLMQTINEKWSTKKCPLCGNNDWTIDPDVMTLTVVDEDRTIKIGSGKIVPLTTITCNNCGNVVLINPLAIGCLDN